MKTDHSRRYIHRTDIRADKPVMPRYLKIVIAILVTLLLLYFALTPLRVKGANALMETGDNYLKERKYISALVAYRKSQYLKNNDEIESRIKIARESEEDINKLEPFLREINDISGMNEIADANKVPANEYEGIVAAKKFIENDRADLAILAATTVTEMDENYRDAWLYLGIANYTMMKDGEISGDAREFYKGKALEAFERAKSLDETNEDVAKYLEALK